jgi:competence protein ComEC
MENSVAFLDVGQGDSTLVVDQDNGLALLIDCPAGRAGTVADGLNQFGARLKAVVASHSDADHFGGLVNVLSRHGSVTDVYFNLDTVAMIGDKNRLTAALRALAGFSDRGVALHPIYRGDEIAVGNFAVSVLAPNHAQLARAQGHGDRNHSSLVAVAHVQALRVLIAGDTDGPAWSDLLDSGVDLSADVFLVPHHGGTMPDHLFDQVLDTVKAQYHVVSVGTTNGYGHPSESTLHALARRVGSARVLCTEVNHRCAGDAALPVAVAMGLPTSSLNTHGLRVGACPCAGTIVFRIVDGVLTVDPSEVAHGEVIDQLGAPACRAHRLHEATVR